MPGKKRFRKLAVEVSVTLLVLMAAAPLRAEWEKIDAGTNASLRGLSVVNVNVVWASGTGGTVIRTVDGGKQWSVITVPSAEKLDFRGIRAFDENNAVIISSGEAEKGQARIYRTLDGGATWKQVFEDTRRGIFLDAIAFWNRQHGIVLSDPIEGKFVLFTTDDGGATWKQLPPAALPAALPKEGAFAASNSCLAVQGTRNVWFATGGAKVARVFHSADRGQTWSVAETPMHPANDSSGIFSLYFEDSHHGSAVGGDYAHPGALLAPGLLRTTDGGATWHACAGTDQPGVYLSSIASFWGPGKDSEIALGSVGAFIGEGGSAWKKELSENLNSLAVTSYAASGQSPIIWAVGQGGIVMRDRIHYHRGRRR
ncbi:MAG TPA: hypothetical protein VKW06_03695 [Candidatus Angelobacter sp.]|nr:hypothetical protein [Candidatus Angelobacter sp.]